jgi:endonuclease YncB( thermonuclease family)
LTKQKRANEAKEWLKQKLLVDTKVMVISKALDKYGRILGEIVLDNQNISDLLLEQKLVDPY